MVRRPTGGIRIIFLGTKTNILICDPPAAKLVHSPHRIISNKYGQSAALDCHWRRLCHGLGMPGFRQRVLPRRSLRGAHDPGLAFLGPPRRGGRPRAVRLDRGAGFMPTLAESGLCSAPLRRLQESVRRSDGVLGGGLGMSTRFVTAVTPTLVRRKASL
jgi:hypothetical protein